jgi:hypothetical protein
MTAEEKKAAFAGFIASLGDRVYLTDQARTVHIQGVFSLEAALEAAFVAVDKCRSVVAARRAIEVQSAEIFDP